MNILLWIVQALLILLYLAGGVYKVVKPEDLVPAIPAMSTLGWRVFGVLEVAGAVLLVLPAVLGRGQVFTPMVAGVLAVETLVLAALYARQSLALSTENPLVWAAVMALAAGFLAVARHGQGTQA
jgi:hypothetical protein